MEYISKISLNKEKFNIKDLEAKNHVDNSNIHVTTDDKELWNSGLVNRGEINSMTNLLNLSSGFYSVNGISHPEFPTADSYYGALIMMDGEYKSQTLIAGPLNEGGYYYRRYIPESSNWSEWGGVPTGVIPIERGGTNVDYLSSNVQVSPVSSSYTIQNNNSVYYPYLNKVFLEIEAVNSAKIGKNNKVQIATIINDYLPICNVGCASAVISNRNGVTISSYVTSNGEIYVCNGNQDLDANGTILISCVYNI